MSRDRIRSSDDPWATDEPIDSESIEEGLAKEESDLMFYIIKKLPDLIESLARLSISSFKIISILLILLFAGVLGSWVFFGGGGMTIMPFETFGLENNLSGTSIAHLLNCELQNIKETDATASTIEIPPDITSGIPIEDRTLASSIGASQFPNQNQYGDFDSLVLESESISIPLTNMGTVGMGDTSLSIGNLLLFMRDLFRNSPSEITGSLQKYGSTVILVATFEDHTTGRTTSWEVRKNVTGNGDSINYQIPSMVKDLAFRIALYFGTKKDLPQNWSSLEYLVQGEKAYINYNITGNPVFLTDAMNKAYLAIESERNYRKPSSFLANLAFFFIKENRSNDAEHIFLSISPFNPIRCNIGLGLSYSEEGNYTEAVMAYDKAILLDPTNILALNSRGIALTNLHNTGGAIQDYDTAIKLDPKNSLLWNNKGNALEKQKKYDLALQAYNKSIELDPKNAVPWNNKGNTFFYDLHDCDQALQAYNNSIGLDPTYAGPWNNKGNVFYYLHDYAQALQAYNNSIGLDPKNAGLWNNKGNAFDALHNYDQALKSYNKSIELNSKFADAWNQKGWTLYEIKKYNESLKAANKSLELNPKSANIWDTKGAALSGLGRYKVAIECFDKAIELDSKQAMVWYHKGEALKALGRTTESNTAFDKAEELGYKG